ncbi:hypothetical protein OF829_10480 [Sphingomonas sp. LB-2]|uniref:hypothetical protein n=1 Tax=Sphingomonas caeni TaxID=2984949 RepID=UPI002231CB31|nr:hypothetical protein [Sphingomonas caeni]MCW3847669.1 hypothetical protein [Sphingomonas caeni]
MSDQDLGGLDELLARIEELERDPATAPEAGQLVKAMLAVLGSGPSIAKIQSILASDGEPGPLEQHAITEQQRENIRNMVATIKIAMDMIDHPAIIPLLPE